MKTEISPSPVRGLPAESCKSTARLVATFGGSRILRHHDGSLDVCSNSPTERDAALAWMCVVSPDLVRRVRPGPAAPATS